MLICVCAWGETRVCASMDNYAVSDVTMQEYDIQSVSKDVLTKTDCA